MRTRQRGGDRGFAARHRLDRGIGAGFDHPVIGGRCDAVERHHPVGGGVRHTVIGDEHQIGGLVHRRQSVDQPADLRIDAAHRRAGFG